MLELTNNTENNTQENIPNHIDTYYLWGLYFMSQSVLGRLRAIELGSMGVTPEQSGVLALLEKNNGKSSIAEMANAWTRQKNSVSTLVNRMAKQGLVKKIKIPRIKELEIEITPKGRELHKKIRENSKVLDAVFAILSEEDKALLARYFTLIRDKSKSMLDNHIGSGKLGIFESTPHFNR